MVPGDPNVLSILDKEMRLTRRKSIKIPVCLKEGQAVSGVRAAPIGARCGFLR
jgi:hypothetical protein